MLNMNFEERVVVRLDDISWQLSPSSGVERKMLERQAAERGHATSVVRYAPGSRFAPHVHAGGEEFLVLSGVFSDESGNFPRGSYVRNSINSKHAPHSDGGCTIFVKLCQMEERDEPQLHAVVHPELMSGRRNGEQLLHESRRERVTIERLAEGSRQQLSGAELLIVEGAVEIDDRRLEGQSWLRIPARERAELRALRSTLLWKKTRHLE